MIIKVLSLNSNSNESLVSFESIVGNGIAVWSGNLPAQNDSVDVELNIDDDFTWGENITTTDTDTSTITMENDELHFVAEVVALEDEDCLTIKLGGTILFLDIEGAPNDISGWVKGLASQVSLHPSNL